MTGATGFIGRALARRLVERGDRVTALVRARPGPGVLPAAVSQVTGDVLDRGSLERALAGADAVVHAAAMVQFRMVDRDDMFAANVTGTRNVLDAAAALRVPRVLYLSSVAVFGDTKGRVVAEGFERDAPYLTTYEETKHLAHQEAVARRRDGMDIVNAMPTVVFGPGDILLRGVLGTYLRRRLLLVVNPGRVMSTVHVEDLADGLLILLDRGAPEDYILTESNTTFGELLGEAERITGIPVPEFEISMRMALAGAQVADAVSVLLGRPLLVSTEAVRSLGASRAFDGAKMRRLGWSPQPFRARFAETLRWFAEDLGLPFPEAALPSGRGTTARRTPPAPSKKRPPAA